MGKFRRWHEAGAKDVRSQGRSGRTVLAASTSPSDPKRTHGAGVYLSFTFGPATQAANYLL
jgi:hypothetical protein